MRNELIDSRLLPRLKEHFMQQRALLENANTNLDSAGDTNTVSYSRIADGVPAVVRMLGGSERRADEVAAIETYEILLMGQWAGLRPSSRVTVDGIVYDVLSIEFDPFGEMTHLTARIVT